MSLNAIDFLRECANYLVEDRPDLYDHDTAVAELSNAMEHLRQFNKPYGAISFSSYLMGRFWDDNVEEFMLTRKLASLVFFEDEEECDVYSYTHDIEGLPHVLDIDDGA